MFKNIKKFSLFLFFPFLSFANVHKESQYLVKTENNQTKIYS